MKRFFLTMFLFLATASLARAQGPHGKVLLVSGSIYSSSDRFEQILSDVYRGKVDSSSILPQDLSGYDAIFLFAQKYFGAQDSSTLPDQMRLIEYLSKGGQLYAESYWFLTRSYPDTLRFDTLWRYLGLQKEFMDALIVTYDRVHGVDSEFTRGIDTSWPGDPFGVDGDYFPIGEITPVLYGREYQFYQDDIFAWVPADSTIRAVVCRPDEQNYDKYYKAFLIRVLCNYFGLCTEAVDASRAKPKLDFQAVIEGTQASIAINSEESGDLYIVNLLGIPVLEAPFVPGAKTIPIPPSLPAGIYFAKAKTASGQSLKPFVVGGN